jgi:two-component system OmpR family response regulator
MALGSVPKVLVVDDEENIRYLVGSALELAGFESLGVETGREAIEAATSFQPDVVVLDVMLPDLDGFTVLQRLRDRGSQAPVIFLTARVSVEDRVRGLTTGGADYQVKPFAVAELVARIRLRLNEESGGLRGGHLRVADLELEPEAHRVVRATEVVHLSPTEYKLLHYLMMNAGRVVTRTQILDHVWSYDFDGESTVVDTYISYLRRKVDHVEPKLIHTIRGVGFTVRVGP